MRYGVRFGQESKCSSFTSRSSVDEFGLKAQACRYFGKSCFVLAGQIMLFVCGCLKGTIGVLGVVFYIVVGMTGTSHNPCVWLRYPVSTCWPCLKTWSVSLMNRARQLLSQSCAIDRRLPVRRLGRIWTVWDRVDSAVDSGIVTHFVAVMVSPFAMRTVGPFFTVVMLLQFFWRMDECNVLILLYRLLLGSLG